MVPFSLRLIHAEVASVVGQHGEAIDRLYNLLHTCQVGRERLLAGLSEDASPLPDGFDVDAIERHWAARIDRKAGIVLRGDLGLASGC